MKNLIILIILLTVQLSVAAQTNIKVILKTDLNIDSVEASDMSAKDIHRGISYKDTLDIRFNKHNIDLYNIHFFSGGKLYAKQLWLDTGNITLKAHTNNSDIIIDTVINSPIYYHVIDYHLKKFNAGDSVARNSYSLNEVQKNIENPFSIMVAFEFVNFNQNSKAELLKLKMLLSTQKTDLTWFALYPMVTDRMNMMLNVKSINLSDYKFINRQHNITNIDLNKYDYYILDFWFYGCTGCMQQHKLIKADYLKFKDKKVTVIGISTDRNFKVWNKYLSEDNYNWDNYLQSGKNTLTEYLGIHAFPEYLLLNKKGEVLGGFDSWSDILNSVKLNSQ